LLKRLSIRQLLLLAFLLAGLLPAMIVSFLSFYQARNALKAEIKHDMQTLSGTVANDIERVLFERIQNVHSWSQLGVMQDIQIGDIDKRVSSFLQEVQTSYGDMYHAIYVVNTHQQVIASSHATQINQLVKPASPWFQVQIAKQSLSVGKIADNRLAISQAVLDANTNEPIGTLVAEFNWQVIQDLLKNAVQKPAAAALIDGENQIVASTANWESIYAEHEMRASQHFSQRLNLQGWQVSIEKLHSVAVAPVHRLGYVFLALLLTTLFFAAILVRPIAQAITDPLAKLTHFVSGFAQNRVVAAPKVGPPEVQALSLAFEQMMTDLKKTQADLTRAAKLAVVGEMSAAMSHEVRTPLGILRSSADLLMREPHMTAEGKEVLGFIISETERLNKLVSTLIDAARPRPPALSPVNLVDIVRNVIALLKSQAQLKEIHITFSGFDTGEQAAILALADADQMTQVLMNLLMNAIQVLPEQGNIAVHLAEASDHIALDVLDDGPGIMAENQAQIFEPFFTQRAGGVGLGLAMVKQLVEAHDGEIHYQASPMGGAQFCIRLPKVASAAGKQSSSKM
jgi:two-component system, NtrC family, sensor histidine kinase HydH